MWNRGNIEDAVADEYGVLYSKDGKRLLKCKQQKQSLLKSPMVRYHVREGTKVICSSAFSGCETFEKIIIPNSVETIEYGAFMNCRGLTEVAMESAQEIDDESVYRFRVHKGLPIRNIETVIGDSAFADCTSLTTLTIGNTVKEIGPSAFVGCKSLKVVNYNATACISAGDSEHYSYHYIFYGCDNLTKVNIGRNVRIIPPCLFGYCKSLPELNFPGNIKIAGGFECCTSLKRVTIGDGKNIIADGAFSSCEALTEVIIGDGENIIADEAFRSCEALIEVIIGNGVHKIGNWAFVRCENLTTVTIGNSPDEIKGWEYSDCNNFWRINTPNALSLIGHGAFMGCSALTEVTIADGICEIGMQAFDRCTSLNKLHLGKSVTKIGGAAFASCISLREVIISDSITEIGVQAFFRCTGLTSITIPESVTSIGDGAFARCEGLTEIYSKNPIPPKIPKGNGHLGIEENCILNVPKGAAEAYSTADGWKDFKKIVEKI